MPTIVFHRLTAPTYTGGLPSNYDYVNNATSGTPSFVSGQQTVGPNAGSYFVTFGESATSADANRPAGALAQNTDYLDNLLHQDLAVVIRTSDATTGGSTPSVTLTGPGIFLGTGSDALKDLFAVTDANEGVLFSGTTPIAVASISGGAVGSGFSTGDVTLTFNTPIPVGLTYHIYYGLRTNLASLSADAVTSATIRNIGKIDNATEVAYNGGPAWAYGTTNPATTVDGQLTKIITDLSSPTSPCGADQIGASGIGLASLSSAAEAPYTLSTGTVQGSLENLVGFANALYLRFYEVMVNNWGAAQLWPTTIGGDSCPNGPRALCFNGASVGPSAGQWVALGQPSPVGTVSVFYGSSSDPVSAWTPLGGIPALQPATDVCVGGSGEIFIALLGYTSSGDFDIQKALAGGSFSSIYAVGPSGFSDVAIAAIGDTLAIAAAVTSNPSLLYIVPASGSPTSTEIETTSEFCMVKVGGPSTSPYFLAAVANVAGANVYKGFYEGVVSWTPIPTTGVLSTATIQAFAYDAVNAVWVLAAVDSAGGRTLIYTADDTLLTWTLRGTWPGIDASYQINLECIGGVWVAALRGAAPYTGFLIYSFPGYAWFDPNVSIYAPQPPPATLPRFLRAAPNQLGLFFPVVGTAVGQIRFSNQLRGVAFT